MSTCCTPDLGDKTSPADCTKIIQTQTKQVQIRDNNTPKRGRKITNTGQELPNEGDAAVSSLIILHATCSTPNTLHIPPSTHCALTTLHSLRSAPYSLHLPFPTHTLRSTLNAIGTLQFRTLQSTLCTLRSALYTVRFTFHTLHFLLRPSQYISQNLLLFTLHTRGPIRTLHSTLRTPQFEFRCVSHTAPWSLHSTLHAVS